MAVPLKAPCFIHIILDGRVIFFKFEHQPKASPFIYVNPVKYINSSKVYSLCHNHLQTYYMHCHYDLKEFL